MEEKLIVSASPHIRKSTTTQRIMLDVIIALIPAVIASVIIFGLRSLVVIADCVVSCVVAEYICRKVMKRENTVSDLSAVVTGLLLGLNLPVSINPIFAMFGSVVAIVVVKQMFGGIGNNFVNPALAARVIMLSSFPKAMTTWTEPFWYKNGVAIDAVTSATPLAQGSTDVDLTLMDLFLGTTPGCLGETCALAILIGGIYLIARKVINPVIPVGFIGTVAILSFVSGQDVLFQLLSGGLMIAAMFMASDYTTTPITTKGKLVFAIGCGVITFLIRTFASLPEGVSFSILIMNILVPLIERATNPKPFGEKESKNA